MADTSELILSAKCGKIAKGIHSSPHLFVFGKGVVGGFIEGNSRSAKKYWVVNKNDVNNAVILAFNIGKHRSISLIQGDEKDERVQLLKNLAHEEWVIIKNDIHETIERLSEFSKKLGDFHGKG